MPDTVSTQLIDNWFRYRAPDPADIRKFDNIRNAGRELALVIYRNTPVGPEQYDAIQAVRQGVFLAIQASAGESGVRAESAGAR